MKNCLIALTAVIASLGVFSVCPSSEQQKPAKQQKKLNEEDKASIWMKGKLQFSQDILAGLTRADFDKIKTNAQAMNFMGYLEKWARAERKDYKRQITYFQFANQELIRQARKKNLDGATLAYIQLTVSCVQCHKIVRDTKK